MDSINLIGLRAKSSVDATDIGTVERVLTIDPHSGLRTYLVRGDKGEPHIMNDTAMVITSMDAYRARMP